MKKQKYPCEEHPMVVGDEAKKDYILCNKCGYKVWSPTPRGRNSAFNYEARWSGKR